MTQGEPTFPHPETSFALCEIDFDGERNRWDLAFIGQMLRGALSAKAFKTVQNPSQAVFIQILVVYLYGGARATVANEIAEPPDKRGGLDG